MSLRQCMRCRQQKKIKGSICVPDGSSEAMICRPRRKKVGGKKETPACFKGLE